MVLFFAAGGFGAGHHDNTFAEPFVLGFCVVVAGLETEDFLYNRYTAEGETAVSSKSVILLSVFLLESITCEIQERTYLGAPAQSYSSQSFILSSDLEHSTLSDSNFKTHSTPGRNSS